MRTLRIPGNNAEADILISERSTGEALELLVVPQYSGGNSTEIWFAYNMGETILICLHFLALLRIAINSFLDNGPILLFLGLQADKRGM